MSNFFTQAVPDVVSDALLITGTTFLLIHAGHRHQRFLDTVNDFIDLNVLRRSSQQVTTPWATHTLDDLAAAKFDEKLFKISQGDTFT